MTTRMMRPSLRRTSNSPSHEPPSASACMISLAWRRPRTGTTRSTIGLPRASSAEVAVESLGGTVPGDHGTCMIGLDSSRVADCPTRQATLCPWCAHSTSVFLQSSRIRAYRRDFTPLDPGRGPRAAINVVPARLRVTPDVSSGCLGHLRHDRLESTAPADARAGRRARPPRCPRSRSAWRSPARAGPCRTRGRGRRRSCGTPSVPSVRRGPRARRARGRSGRAWPISGRVPALAVGPAR